MLYKFHLMTAQEAITLSVKLASGLSKSTMGHWTIEVLFQSLEGISLSFRSASNFFNLFFLFFAFFLWSDKNLVRRERKRLIDLSLLLEVSRLRVCAIHMTP